MTEKGKEDLGKGAPLPHAEPCWREMDEDSPSCTALFQWILRLITELRRIAVETGGDRLTASRRHQTL